MTHQTSLRCKGRTRSKFLRILFVFVGLSCVQSIISAEPFGSASVGIHIPGGNIGAISESRCPRVCSCNGLTVDCSHQRLTQVPRKISADVERL